MKKHFLFTGILFSTLFIIHSVIAKSIFPHMYKDGQVNHWSPAAFAASQNSFHFITHGRPGQLLIEGRWRNAAQIAAFIQGKQLLSPRIKQLNIYGCSFAKGAQGLAAVQYLQSQLGVTVAASTNITGAGGDYLLEVGNVEAGHLFAGFSGSLQCGGTAGGRDPGDDFDGDGICNSADLDDDNDGILDEKEQQCGGAVLNVSDYQHSAPSSSVTDMGGGVMVTTDFSTTTGGGVSIDETAGSAVGDLIYHFTASQNDTTTYYYITDLDFNRPVRVLIGFPGTEAPGTHNGNDYINFTTPGSNTPFVVYNPDTAIQILQNEPGAFRYRPNTTGSAEVPNINNRREYFIETRFPVTKVRIKAASTASDRTNHVSVRVLIRVCDTLDTDNDAFANQFDLDSDGDGCNDIFEAAVPVATKGTGNYTDSVAVAPGSPKAGANGYADTLETRAESDTANFTGNHRVYTQSASLNACMDSDDDGISDRDDIDKDNDGILDIEEGAGCGSAGRPFTSLEQARANVTSPGTYYFNLGGNSFQTYVDTGGYTMIAIDYGDGLGVLPTSTSLGLNKSVNGRGILNAATLSALGTIESIRISSNSQEKGGVDVVSSNATLIGRVKANQALHRGVNDNSYNNDWTGTNQENFTNDATNNVSETNNLRYIIMDPAGARPGFVWRPRRNFQRVYWQGQEILPNERHVLWVRGNNTGTVCATDTDADGIPNHLDADSDGDGCSDAYESGVPGATKATGSYTDSVVVNPASPDVGANGYKNSLETSTDNGTPGFANTYSTDALDNSLNRCDTDKDGIGDREDMDDDNDGVPDEVEMKCGGAPINLSGYTHSAPSSSTTNIGSGINVVTSFSTLTSGGVSLDETAGTSAGDLSYHFTASQGDTTAYYYITELNFDHPVRVLLGFPGTEAPGTHNGNDIFEFTTPGLSIPFVVYNPDNAITILQNTPGRFRYHPNTEGEAEVPDVNNRREYFVETRFPVTRVRVRAASTATGRVNHAAVRVLIRACDTLDTDSDGIANLFDLDSDGDGCNDIFEGTVPGATKGTGNYTDSVAVAPGSPNAGANGYANTLETSADSDTANFTSTYRAYAESASLNACMDSDDDAISDRVDIDKDNDGILDIEEGAGCGTAGQPFTSLEQARANVTNPGTYYFKLGDNSFQTYVDTGGYTMIAIDYGDGWGALSTTTSLGLNKSVNGRGILNAATLSALGTIESIRISSNSQVEGGVDVVSTNATLISRVKANQTLHRGLADNDINESWTGLNQQYFRVNATSNGTESNNDLSDVIMWLSGAFQGIHWIPVNNNQRVYWSGQEILPNEHLVLWVRGNNTGTVCAADTDADGIPGHLDADSDGDGCSDAEETGVGGTLQPGLLLNKNGTSYSFSVITQGPYGANGFADALETTPGSGSYNGSYDNYDDATNNAVSSCVLVPLIRPDVGVTFTDRTVNGDLSTNDSIPSGSAYAAATAVPGYSNPGSEMPTINSGGSYSFSSATTGVYKFLTSVCPASGSTNCPTALLTIHVIEPLANNNAPAALPDFATIRTGSSATLGTLTNDEAGVQGSSLDPSSVRIVTLARHGDLAINAANGNIRYTPRAGFAGTDTLYYRVCDDRETSPNCDTSLQIITVLPASASHNLVASDDYAFFRNDAVQTGKVAINDFDSDGATLSVAPQSRSVSGVGDFTLASDGSYSFDPDDAFSGPANFTYEVCDDHSSSTTCNRATAHFLVRSNLVLPAKLVAFWGRNNGDVNQIKWTTSIEENTAYFELRHSTNGRDFATITKINAAGNSNAVRNYEYMHTTPAPGNNYYRLTTVDLDGRRENSKVINVTVRQPGTLVVYPNPSNGVFVVTGSRAELSTITLFSATGANLTHRAQIAIISDEKRQINLSALANGVYYLKTKTGGVRVVKW